MTNINNMSDLRNRLKNAKLTPQVQKQLSPQVSPRLKQLSPQVSPRLKQLSPQVSPRLKQLSPQVSPRLNGDITIPIISRFTLQTPIIQQTPSFTPQQPTPLFKPFTPQQPTPFTPTPQPTPIFKPFTPQQPTPLFIPFTPTQQPTPLFKQFTPTQQATPLFNKFTPTQQPTQLFIQPSPKPVVQVERGFTPLLQQQFKLKPLHPDNQSIKSDTNFLNKTFKPKNSEEKKTHQ